MSEDARRFCTFYLDRHLFGVDVLDVQEVIRYQAMTRVPLAPPVVEGLINLRGQIVTALDLRRRLELPVRPAGETPMNVVVQTDEGAISFLVDRIGDVVEATDDQFEPAPGQLQGVPRDLITGVYKLEHELLVVLDTERTAAVLAGVGAGD
jgi:purine-binding chemotaxis protein CheW